MPRRTEPNANNTLGDLLKASAEAQAAVRGRCPGRASEVAGQAVSRLGVTESTPATVLRETALWCADA